MANWLIDSYSGVICSGCLSHHKEKGCIRLVKTGQIPPTKIVNGVEVCTEFENKRPPTAIATLRGIEEALRGKGILSHQVKSQRGVPILLIDGPDGDPVASVCWFRRTRVLRCFHPWPCVGQEQTKFTTSITNDLIDYVARLLS